MDRTNQTVELKDGSTPGFAEYGDYNGKPDRELLDWPEDEGVSKVALTIWQGDADMNVPVNQGKYQAGQLPNSNRHIMKNKGHMFLLGEWKNVLSELIK